MAYRKNEGDKVIDQVELAASDSTVVVNTIAGAQKSIRPNPAKYRRMGIVGSHSDRDYVVNSKAGKARTSEAN